MWSQITYGMIAWKLTEKTCRFLANWNAKNLARITGRTIPRSTGTQRKRDLVKSVRNWRMKWVALAAMSSVQDHFHGHILRKEDSS